MHDTSIPVLILSNNQEDVELFNRTLRQAGHAVRCSWLQPADELPAALRLHQPHLIVLFANQFPTEIKSIAELRQEHAAITPLVVISDTADESSINEAMQAGAQDLVSVENTARLCAVCERELKTYRVEYALNHALQSTEGYRSEVQSLLSSSADAMAVVQEGIVVEANQAWAEIFCDSDTEAVIGPVMDHFAEGSQLEIKQALAACSRGQWSGDALTADILSRDGELLGIKLGMEQSIHDGEPAIRLFVQTETSQAPAESSEAISINSEIDPATGLLSRRTFLQRLAARLDEPKDRRARALALIRPDSFKQIEHTVGPVLSEEVIVQIGSLLAGHLHDADLAGRFGGTVFALLLERENLDQISDWIDAALSEISAREYEAANLSLSLTCSAGLAEIGTECEDIDELLRLAEKANRSCRQEGGNKLLLKETTNTNTLIRRADSLWVKRIKSALMDKRFRLAHFNIASLAGTREVMFDTFLRLIDEQGDEVPADDFIGSARRNQLLRAIDRWVVGASLEFAASTEFDVAFVKLSDESLLDGNLFSWLDDQATELGVDKKRICFQVSEEDAGRHTKQTRDLANTLRQSGYRFAIENFGIGSAPAKLLSGTPMDFIKFDGSLMKQIVGDSKLQDRVRELAGLANREGIGSIATHVENADTMAVLFQLGVGYMQGHYLQEPDVVLEEAI